MDISKYLLKNFTGSSLSERRKSCLENCDILSSFDNKDLFSWKIIYQSLAIWFTNVKPKFLQNKEEIKTSEGMFLRIFISDCDVLLMKKKIRINYVGVST